MRKTVIVVFVISIPILFLMWYQANEKALLPQEIFPDQLHTLQINDATIEIELADTFRKRVQGLSGRIALEENKGLFFVFDESDFHSIWMKEMFFPIDIIWIDENLHIVDIKENALPQSYPETFRPQVPARYILEIHAGFADEFDLRIDDSVIFK